MFDKLYRFKITNLIIYKVVDISLKHDYIFDIIF